MKKRKSTKGQHFTSDYIPYEIAEKQGNSLLWGENPVIGFYILFSINTGLRVSDVTKLKHSDLNGCKPGTTIWVTEKKTKKSREIYISEKIAKAYSTLIDKLKTKGKYDIDGFIFTSKKGTVYATASLIAILKTVFEGYAENISTHSLRKTFGRHIYNINGQSENVLIQLSDIFNHSSIGITRTYLGFSREEKINIYKNL
jgi:integrase